MSGASPAPAPLEDAADADAWERALLDRQLEALGRLAEMGMAIAGAIERRATAEEPGAEAHADLRHAAIDFARVARAVRMTFALQSRLIADFKGRSRPAEAAAAADGPIEVRWIEDPSYVEAARKSRVRRSVRRAAQDAGRDAETVERLVQEAGERLEDDDIHAQIMTRPFDEIVALICGELGLEAGGFASVAGADGRTRPPPLAGEAPRRGGGGIPPTHTAEVHADAGYFP